MIRILLNVWDYIEKKFQMDQIISLAGYKWHNKGGNMNGPQPCQSSRHISHILIHFFSSTFGNIRFSEIYLRCTVCLNHAILKVYS